MAPGGRAFVEPDGTLRLDGEVVARDVLPGVSVAVDGTVCLYTSNATDLIVDVTPDRSPIIGKTPVPGLYVNCGWGTGGFKATPASGWAFAWTIAKDEPHAINQHYTLDRFHRGIVIDEKGQGSTPRMH